MESPSKLPKGDDSCRNDKRTVGRNKAFAAQQSGTPETEAQMPFDGIGYSAREELLNKLDQVMARLASPDKWCQHALGMRDGRRCVVGALDAVIAKRELYSVILASARSVSGVDYTSVQRFNDDPATDHQRVLAVLADARQRILADDIPPSIWSQMSILQWLRLAFKPARR